MSNIFDFKIQCFNEDPKIFDSEGKWQEEKLKVDY